MCLSKTIYNKQFQPPNNNNNKEQQFHDNCFYHNQSHEGKDPSFFILVTHSEYIASAEKAEMVETESVHQGTILIDLFRKDKTFRIVDEPVLHELHTQLYGMRHNPSPTRKHKIRTQSYSKSHDGDLYRDPYNATVLVMILF